MSTEPTDITTGSPPGRTRRALKTLGRGAVWLYAGDMNDVKRTHRSAVGALRRALGHDYTKRVETFDDAMSRLQLTPSDVARRSAQLRVIGRAYAAVAIVAFGFFVATPALPVRLNYVITSLLVFAVTLTKYSVVRWRRAQCEHRVLVGYVTYWAAAFREHH